MTHEPSRPRSSRAFRTHGGGARAASAARRSGHSRAAFAVAIETLESRLLLARVLGIDVSEYQPTINWNTVKTVGGRGFTILRASHGLLKDTTVDSKMSPVSGAPSVGMYTGFYHYATYNTGTTALQEANFYFDIIKPYLNANSKVLYPVVDVEATRPASMTKAQLTTWVDDFCKQIIGRASAEKGVSITPMIYVGGSNSTNLIDGSTLSQKYPLWIAQWPSTIPTQSTNPTIDNAEPTSYGGWSRPSTGAQGWSFWQDAGDPAGGPVGTCPGVGNGTTTPCDNDVFNGDEESLQDYVIGSVKKWDLGTSVSANITVTAFSTSTGTTGTGVAAGTIGKVLSAPVYANSYMRYQVQFNNGVTGWVPAPNMTTVTPGVTSNPTPANGSTPNPIPSTWTWTAASNANGYRIYIDNVLRGTTTTNSWTFSASLGTGTHTWRVDSVNDSLTATGPNWTFNFTSIGGTPSNPTPVDGLVTTNTTVSFSWDPVPNATTYELYFGTGTTFLRYTGADTHFGPVTRPEGLLTWHVIARNSGSSADGALWSFRVDTTAPTAGFVNSDPAPARYTRTYDFRVSYSDSTDVDRSSFGDGDVMVAGPNGFSQSATFVSNSFNTATYRITAPGGLWDSADVGAYTISQVAGQVKDTAGNYRPAGAITNGTFSFASYSGFAYVLGTTLHVECLPAAPGVTVATSGANVTIDEGPGQNASFPLGSFSDILIHGTAADNAVVVAATLGKPLAVDGGGGSDSLSLDSGVNQTFATDAALTVAGFATNLQLTVHGGALATFNTTQHFASLDVDGTAVLTAGGGRDIAIVTRGLSVNGGFLDLADHALIYEYTGASPLGDATGGNYSGVNSMIASARHGGAWDGTGLTSSAAGASAGRTALLAAEASAALNLTGSATGLFAGQTVDATAVLVKYTWVGDANLSGVVDGDDYFLLDSQASSGIPASPALPLFGAYNGDLDLNGMINGDDYFLIDSVMSRQDGPIV